MIRTLKLIARTLQSWWTADRIRVSPFAGRLPGLREGMRLQLCDRFFVVVRRTWNDSAREVTYQLYCDQGPAGLTCRIDTEPEAGLLHQNGETMIVFPDDVTILSPSTEPGRCG